MENKLIPKVEVTDLMNKLKEKVTLFIDVEQGFNGQTVRSAEIFLTPWDDMLVVEVDGKKIYEVDTYHEGYYFSIDKAADVLNKELGYS